MATGIVWGVRFRATDFRDGKLPLGGALSIAAQQGLTVAPARAGEVGSFEHLRTPVSSNLPDSLNVLGIPSSHSVFLAQNGLSLVVPDDLDPKMVTARSRNDPHQLKRLVLEWEDPEARRASDEKFLREILQGKSSLAEKLPMPSDIDRFEISADPQILQLKDTLWEREYLVKLMPKDGWWPPYLHCFLNQTEPRGRIYTYYRLVPYGYTLKYGSEYLDKWPGIDFTFLMGKAGGMSFIAEALKNIYGLSISPENIEEPTQNDFHFLASGCVNRIYGISIRIRGNSEVYPMAMRLVWDRENSEESTEVLDRAVSIRQSLSMFSEGWQLYRDLAQEGLLPYAGAFYYDPVRCQRIFDYADTGNYRQGGERGLPCSVLALQWVPGFAASLVEVVGTDIPSRAKNRIRRAYVRSVHRRYFFRRLVITDERPGNCTVFKTSKGYQAMLHDLDYAFVLEHPFSQVIARVLTGKFDAQRFELFLKVARHYGSRALAKRAYLTPYNP